MNTPTRRLALPLTPAERALREVQAARALAADPDGQRKAVHEAYWAVSELRASVESAAFNPGQRADVRKAGEALHEALRARSTREVALLAAELALTRIVDPLSA